MLYPLHLEIEGMVCVIVGGGAVAVRKAAGLVACGARITVIAPNVSTRLVEMEACGKVNILRRGYRQGDFSSIKPRLVFLAAATSVNVQAREEARALGIFANDAASDDGGDFVVPSRIRRGSLLLAVSTGGAEPAFSRFLRRTLEDEFPSSFAPWMERLKVLRADVQKAVPKKAQAAFWKKALNYRVLEHVRAGELRKAEEEVRNAISDFGAES